MANETINWYPGHMKKATRMMEDSLRLVDARGGAARRAHPQFQPQPGCGAHRRQQAAAVVLNRADQADAAATAALEKSVDRQRGPARAGNGLQKRRGVNAFPAAARSLLKEKIERAEARDQVGQGPPVHGLGVPNVGKSSFINRLAGRKAAETSDRPGVTRGKQWITLNGGILLLDTPGILWPKFESPEVGYSLAWTGAINDNILDVELGRLPAARAAARALPRRDRGAL